MSDSCIAAIALLTRRRRTLRTADTFHRIRIRSLPQSVVLLGNLTRIFNYNTLLSYCSHRLRCIALRKSRGNNKGCDTAPRMRITSFESSRDVVRGEVRETGD